MKKMLILCALVCSLLMPTAQADVAPVAIAGLHSVALTDVHFVKSEAGKLRIEGMVKNLTDHSFRQVYVAFNLLRNGMVVGYTTAITFHLAPDETWLFQAPCRTRVFKPDHFRLAELSAIP
ncbi:hypothetical protein AFK62_09285 [Cronobacter condimenti 1330]|uniref:Uncharacterized protein n=2 Tax=Cronobacter condimenti 1330 TaxID=1073999 RepID=A0ABM5VBX2_9ENTR|nr:FxLYD domain-containing protein [Cronobacter condimenti]ALB62682.1 hypothetical protein AFK62_09285 [Cronobacter condimenti 1330]